MKKFLLFLSVTACFTACSKKDNSSDPGTTPPASAVRIKTIANSGVRTYTYNDQNKIVTSTYSNGSKYEYEYQPGKVNVKKYGAGGVYISTDVYLLNADGFCTSITNASQPGVEQLYFYNADKSLAKTTYTSNGNSFAQDYFYSNGNCDSIRFSMNGNLSYTYKATFYTDKVNVLSLENSGENFFGKCDKNLVKSDYNLFSNGATSVVAEYSYEFDSMGRVSKQLVTKQNNSSINLYTYY